MIRFAVLASISLLALAACGKPAAPANESDTVPLPAPGATQTSGAAPAVASSPAKPAGPAEAAQKRDDDYAVNGAHVTQVEWLPNLNAKIFSNAGGDPAINGLVTYIGFPPEGPDEPWAVFQVGDFEDWKVVEQGPGKVVLQVRVSRIDPSSGDPVTENKTLIVNFTTGANPTVTVTPGA